MKKMLFCFAIALLICLTVLPVIATDWGTVPQIKEGEVVIDGIRDDIYREKGLYVAIEGNLGNTFSSAYGQGELLHDGKYLYVYVDVIDPDVNTAADFSREPEAPWELDSAEVFLDYYNDGVNIRQYRIGATGWLSYWKSVPDGDTNDVQKQIQIAAGADAAKYFEGATAPTEEGYACEFKIPLQNDMRPGHNIRFMLQINDCYLEMRTGQAAYAAVVSSYNPIEHSWHYWWYDNFDLGNDKGLRPKDAPATEDEWDLVETMPDEVMPGHAPETEAPETEAPETEAPETEAPVTEAPETEAPETEAPETEAPVTEAPETEAPVTEAPETEAPVTEAPETEAPVTEAPETEAPETEAPETEAPETEAPETEAPETEAPVTEAPETEAPETEAPATEAPKADEGSSPVLPIAVGATLIVAVVIVAAVLLKKKK